ncbi:hypothetical protein MMIC_P1955 [Mariprofundus micogutta]|uniref:DUF748 domain-containing protein n=1 Tax=Mariprofundus micogutta TaxID=1921010 RepID=A0A1L8CQ06_9PROT|nr:DUF748 domain-containing protein [Mariprofundus micogutta]GAV20977.1 hypothetical protein MMIC_P1955 [Mariprofundus micogutta]
MPDKQSEAADSVTYSAMMKPAYAIAAAVVALGLLFVSLLPLAVEYAAESWLKDHGVQQAEIENIDINLFTGEVLLQELKAGDGLNISHLAVNIDWLPLFKKIVYVRSFELHSANFDLHQDDKRQWQLADIHSEPAQVDAKEGEMDEQGDPWLTVVDGLDIQALRVNVNGIDMQLKLPVESLHLSLSGLLNREQSLNAEVKLGETDFTSFGYKVSNENLELAATLFFSVSAEDIASSLRTENTGLKLSGLKFAQDDGKKLAAIDAIKLVNVQSSGLNRHKVEALNLGNISMQPQLTGAGAVQLASIDVQNIDANLDGKLAFASLLLKQLQASGMTGDDDNISLRQLKLQGLTTQPGENLNLDSLSMQGFDLHQKQGKQLLAAIEQLTLKQFAMSGTDKGAFDSLSLSGIKLPASGKKSLGSIGGIVASGATLDTAGLYHLNKLQFNDLNTRLIKKKNGKLSVLDELSGRSKKKPKKTSSQHESTDKSADKKESRKEPVVIIDELLLGRGSKISYRDESVFPPLDTRMTVKKFRFAPLDMSGKRDGRLDMLMRIGRNGELSAKGKLRPNGKRLKTDLVIGLKNFDMPGLSGFVESDFGKSIQTGQFNLDTSISINNNKIDAKNRLLMRKLTLGSSKQLGKAEQKIGMPVNMALDMLRDDRGDIEMNVPISGNLDDPNININEIINKALMSSLSSGAMTYASLVLQPYGSIILAASLAGDLMKEAGKPKLTPIAFEQLEATLNPQMQDYTSKIAGLLKKSKAFRLQLCGVASRYEGVSADGPQGEAGQADVPVPVKTDEELLQLAQARSDAVMSALQLHGIESERLFTCRGKIDEARKVVKARVELTLD